ncbi:hypothetical protein SKAU_G00121400 [Synaphobranchus kaupii]|uniref:Gypsy retrotransposon integrase-like protein 1 n=1 Tax=Synaphobranchus kaupii TaxID=118154 RepID=A0A9Q1FNV7_SYNKA|nr:hypothetical protein SKAU_G00121400 [Synaphobranchus kaupii]
MYVKRKLLEEGPGLTLNRTLELASQCENVEEQMSAMSGTTKAETETVHHVAQKGGRNAKYSKGKPTGKSDQNERKCYRCGHTDHLGRDPKCPARGQTCHKCSGKDHFSTVCCTKPKGAKHGVSNVEEQDDFAFVVKENNTTERLTFSVGGVKLQMLIDSGATSNVMGENTWERLKSECIKCHSYIPKTERKLFSYAASQPLSVKGAFTCEIAIGNRIEQAEFIVVNGKGEALLGKDTAMKLGVLKIGVDVAAVVDIKQSLEQQYPKLFQGVGKLNSKQVSLHINPDVKPVAQPLRRIPFNLRGAVEDKIKQLIDMDIIEPVDGPTPWVNPVVIVPKADKDVRLCLDMRRANQAIERERFPIPTVDEILQGMNGSTVFSKLDLKWGYHQLELTPESRGITTFAVHNGVYQYKRLIFGVSSASEQYQHEVANALTGIEGVENISDDIIVHAHDQETHDRHLHVVLTRLTERGLTLNPDKCQFNMDKLVFMGILLSEKGIGPTAERVRAVAEAREPENAAEVRSFLGLVGYSSRVIPQFATLSEPLRRLTRKDTPFEFGSEQREAFNALKNELARAGTLAYFDKNAQTKVIADASPVGLGAVLIQVQQGDEVPICYVSRSLSDCERKYSQTEREALGLVWACERLHPYVYGRQFTLVTDHKPLEVIYGPHSKPCARIERWVLRLQPYDFKVLYIPGKQNIADSLSRLLGETAKRERHNHGSDEYVRFVAVSAMPKALTTREVEEASATDPELIEVREAIANGRFENCKAYAAIANELCVVGHLVLRGTRIVLPRILHARALTLAHEGHLGIVGTKQHLRTKVWRPGMDRAAERHCKDFHGCQIVARPDPPEPLRPTPLPDGPWRDVAVDLLGPLPSNHSILVVVDYYSRYYEYDILTSTTTEKATAKWAQANGEVERQNASLMKRIRIAHSEGLDWKRELRKYVTVYRSIDHATTGKSPAELLFNRKVRGKLPDVTESRTDMEVRDRDSEQKGKSKLYADERRRAQRSEIEVGDTVLVRQDKVDKFTTPFNTTPHKVVSKAGSHVIVESPTGARYTRNSTFVKKYRTTGPEETTHEQDDTQGVEEVMVDYDKDTVTPPTPTDTSMSDMPNAGRPQRNKRAPQRLSDYIVP